MRTVVVSVLAALTVSVQGCLDTPIGWKDQDGDDCAKYKAKGWCKASWQYRYTDGTGKTADQACCGCGGGNPRMCREFKKMNCKQNCPSGFKEIGSSNHGCCASILDCGGNMKHCEKVAPCPTNLCRKVKLMNCKQDCPSGWKHIYSTNWGCCSSFTSCGGSMKSCEKYLPCVGGRRLEDTDFTEIMTQQYKPQDEETAEDLA